MLPFKLFIHTWTQKNRSPPEFSSNIQDNVDREDKFRGRKLEEVTTSWNNVFSLDNYYLRMSLLK